MGFVVDALEKRGHEPEHVEQTVWQLLQLRRLTPNGYVCRVVRRGQRQGPPLRLRTYDFLMIPWSPEQDRQLELELEDERRRSEP